MFVTSHWDFVSRITGDVSDPIQLQKDFNMMLKFQQVSAIWFAENLPMIGKTEEGLTHPPPSAGHTATSKPS